jgi:signal transduction histidine kinase
VQQALTNVVRHAQAQHATVKVTCVKGRLDLLVQDDGKGMDLGRIRKGTDLTGIRERAHLFGGTMGLES